MFERGTSREIDGSLEILKMCEACADALIVARRIKGLEATLPSKFAWARVGAPELRQRVQIERPAFVEAHKAALAGGSIVFHGGQGAGKTSLAIALFRAMLDHGRRPDASKAETRRALRASFASAYDLARDRARHKLGDGESPLIHRMTLASVALIDDLGSEPEGQFSAVADVIYERHCQDRPTWFTTWCGPSEVAAKYGAGIARRAFEEAHVVEVGSVRG
jgi:DNA replication protein DnaC